MRGGKKVKALEFVSRWLKEYLAKLFTFTCEGLVFRYHIYESRITIALAYAATAKNLRHDRFLGILGITK